MISDVRRHTEVSLKNLAAEERKLMGEAKDKEVTDEKAAKVLKRVLSQLGPKLAGKVAGALGVVFDPFDPAAAATLDEMGVDRQGNKKPVKRDPNNPYGMRKVKK